MIPRFPLRYLPANLLTAANLCMALAAMVLAHQGRYQPAAWLVLWCVLLDKAEA